MKQIIFFILLLTSIAYSQPVDTTGGSVPFDSSKYYTRTFSDLKYLENVDSVNQRTFSDSKYERKTFDNSKKWVLFGDSFSNDILGEYGIVVINKLGLTGTVTHAVGGYPIASVNDTLDALLAVNSDYLDDFDIITLLVGVNDYYWSVPLGDPDPVYVDTSTYAENLRYFIETVLTANPNVELYIMTPPEAGGGTSGITYKADNSAGYSLKDMASLISQICASYAIQCIDLYNLSGFNSQTMPTMTSDGLHPSVAGAQVLGDIITSAFVNKKNFGNTFNTVIDNDYLLKYDGYTLRNSRIFDDGSDVTITDSLKLTAVSPVLSLNNTSLVDYGGINFLSNNIFNGSITLLPTTAHLKINAGRSVGWSGYITLETDSTEKMRITSTGKVGIGTVNPDSQLTVNGGAHIEQGLNVGGIARVGTYDAYPSSEVDGLFITNNPVTNGDVGRGLNVYHHYAGTYASTGINTYAYAEGTNNQDHLNGIQSFTYGSLSTSSDTIINLRGLASYVSQTSGVVTNGVGLYIHTLGGTITNKYAIYQAGEGDKNYFAGNVGVYGASRNIIGYEIFSDAVGVGSLYGLGDDYSTSNQYTASGILLESYLAGGLSFSTYNATASIRFFTNNGDERIRIGSDGKIGISTDAPDSVLTVSGGAHITGGLKVDGTITAASLIGVDTTYAVAWGSLTGDINTQTDLTGLVHDSVNTKQNADADLTDLADGSLTLSKVGGLQDSLTAKANTAWFAISPTLIDDSIAVKMNRSEMTSYSTTTHTHIDFFDTLSISWGVLDTTYTGSLSGWKVPNDITITEISAYTDANTVTFNIEERAETTPNTAGTDVIGSDLVADTNQEETSTFTNATIAKNSWLVPTISATGDVSIFTISVRYIKTD